MADPVPADPVPADPVPADPVPADTASAADDLDVDPALAAAVLEIEAHAASEGWDRPGRLYALVDTAELVRREPALAAAMGLDDASAAGSLTPVEQEQLPPVPLEQALEDISWPDGVAGCAAVVERLVLPPDADAQVPDDPAAAETFARQHPDRQEVRMVVGVTRGGSSYCALRLRSHDEDASVVAGADVVPALVSLLAATLDDDPGGDPGGDPGDGNDQMGGQSR